MWHARRWVAEPGSRRNEMLTILKDQSELTERRMQMSNEFFNNKIFAFTNHHQDCVKRRAALSVSARPHCKDDVQAAKVVNEVWDSCFRDTRPFDEIFR